MMNEQMIQEAHVFHIWDEVQCFFTESISSIIVKPAHGVSSESVSLIGEV